MVGHDSQTVNFAPSQGGWVEFTLDQEGNYPFVTHAFGDMVKGAAGMLRTMHAPKAPAPAPAKAAPAAADVAVTLGDMWVKSSTPTVKAGKVRFSVKNTGATMHGLAISTTPVKLDGGMLDESTFVATGKHLGTGESETITADLKPGTYELVC